jgi:hypothetical protein
MGCRERLYIYIYIYIYICMYVCICMIVYSFHNSPMSRACLLDIELGCSTCVFIESVSRHQENARCLTMRRLSWISEQVSLHSCKCFLRSFKHTQPYVHCSACVNLTMTYIRCSTHRVRYSSSHIEIVASVGSNATASICVMG